jgi:DNA-binding transcriptional regulator YiaG
MKDEISWRDRVRAVRAHLGVTQVEFAKILECTDITVALWESRDKRPYSAIAERFMEIEAKVLKEAKKKAEEAKVADVWGL